MSIYGECMSISNLCIEKKPNKTKQTNKQTSKAIY